MSELLSAVENSDLSQIQTLLKNTENVDLSDREDVIFKAIYSNDDRIVQLLFSDPRNDPSQDDNRPLKLALKCGKLKLTEKFLNGDRVLAQFTFIECGGKR